MSGLLEAIITRTNHERSLQQKPNAAKASSPEKYERSILIVRRQVTKQVTNGYKT
jgi:hypothetical protein